MKKFAAVVLAAIMCAIIVCSFGMTAFAESTAYELNALNMSIPIPDDMIVLTRDSTVNDAFFKTFKLNYDTTMSKLNEGNIYLEAVTEDSSLTLTVTMTRTEDSTKIGSYNSLTDEELTNIMKKLRENTTYKDASPIEYNGVKYICLNMSYKRGEETVQAQQYNTVMNGENINITMQAAPGKELKTADKETLADIIKGTTILNDNFFNRNKGIILYGSITLAAIAVVVVVFILLFKYIRNPNRKHKILVHELAHEHKISETTQIPSKHIFNVIKPTNTFLTKYAPVGEIKGKRGKKARAIAEESREIRSYFEPAPEETVPEENVQNEPVTSVSYEDAPDEIPVDVEAVKEAVAETDSSVQDEAQTEQIKEEVQNEQVDISELVGDIPIEKAETEPQKAVQSEKKFDETADYFDVDPEEGEMFSYADVDTAVEDYTRAKRRLAVNEDEENEDIPNGWDTFKKIIFAIGRGIATVFRVIFIGIVFGITHLKYFCINLHRMIKRKRAMNKRRKIEEQRRREESERRRMEREAERVRRLHNANRGANDLVQVRSSYERRPVPSGTNRQRADRSRERSDYRRAPQGRSSSQRRR